MLRVPTDPNGTFTFIVQTGIIISIIINSTSKFVSLFPSIQQQQPINPTSSRWLPRNQQEPLTMRFPHSPSSPLATWNHNTLHDSTTTQTRQHSNETQ
ncbi:unnamed protein product [Ambrosiozyma monospora]|uniref:Unnamed protein product n=1 Tax=Ambrosiozyma monospora TaxID=43982 RepID=A0ACB5U1G7_AMBMO|nr:unnamed protein product [Ambrosiozyma monospora]